MITIPKNSDEIIDSRDIIARIEELQEEESLDQDEQEELSSLLELAEEGKDYAPDWEYGESLIRDSYFQEYAQDLAEDIGAIDATASWPNDCIDWERAVRELQYDYTALDFDGVRYWVR